MRVPAGKFDHLIAALRYAYELDMIAGMSELPETDPHTSRFELTHQEWEERKWKKF